MGPYSAQSKDMDGIDALRYRLRLVRLKVDAVLTLSQRNHIYGMLESAKHEHIEMNLRPLSNQQKNKKNRPATPILTNAKTNLGCP